MTKIIENTAWRLTLIRNDKIVQIKTMVLLVLNCHSLTIVSPLYYPLTNCYKYYVLTSLSSGGSFVHYDEAKGGNLGGILYKNDGVLVVPFRN